MIQSSRKTTAFNVAVLPKKVNLIYLDSPLPFGIIISYF